MIDREIVIEMRRNGMTYKEIGDVLGVTSQRIEQILKQEGRKRRFGTDIEKIPYEGLYNWLVANERVGFSTLAIVMFGNSGNGYNNLARNFCLGRNSRISKKAYDRLLAKTGMTYEQLFKLREGYKEEADG